jgi:hypothetical protein
MSILCIRGFSPHDRYRRSLSTISANLLFCTLSRRGVGTAEGVSSENQNAMLHCFEHCWSGGDVLVEWRKWRSGQSRLVLQQGAAAVLFNLCSARTVEQRFYCPSCFSRTSNMSRTF